MENIKNRALNALHSFIGDDKNFKPGQYEAIEATLINKRTLVVQKTGWGKSMVYFVCTKLLREEGRGVTLIISPLLSLMKNQIEAAERAGLKCGVLNSSKTPDEKRCILENMKNDELDLVLTTPETLFTDDVQRALPSVKIGLFVIDEAHCISDWGHDFRLEYCRLNKIVKSTMANVPVLATTATANDRVIEDLKEQLGGDVFVSRGPLMRENLSIQILKMKDKASRYGWILDNINKLPGSGIIYCLTQSDCEEISEFLVLNNISARPYHSGLDSEYNTETENMFMNNEIKVIAATIKLGMGYDKSDISFIIHYQMPSNIVAYYQQIGRAGRDGKRAYTFLMFGEEDLDIQNYFIETAFPTVKQAEDVIQCIENNNGLGINDLQNMLNYSKGTIEKALKFLVNEEAVYKEKSKYYRSVHDYHYNAVHYNEIMEIRKSEQQQMLEYLNTDECLSRYIVNKLDDHTECRCGICGNCCSDVFSENVSEKTLIKASDYIDGYILPVIPRKQWMKPVINIDKSVGTNEAGICLSKYGHYGYGMMVKEGKYRDNRFSDRLVDRSVEVLKNLVTDNNITALAYVPSLRSNLVRDFAERLADKLNIKCIDVLDKSQAQMQKEMENSIFQQNNALSSFSIKENTVLTGNVLLVDDIIDSKWTLTVCGYLLKKAGAEKVFPFALASSSKKDG